MTNKEEIAELRAELAKVKAQIAPAPIDHAAQAAWVDQQRANAERRMSRFNPFTRSQLEEMRRAAPDDVVRDIAMRDSHAPLGPAHVIPSTMQQDVPRRAPGDGTGWAREIPLGPQPGIQHVDRLVDAADRADLHERIVKEAEKQELLKP